LEKFVKKLRLKVGIFKLKTWN